MARLPEPSSDDGIWGDVLNDFLQVELNTDGSLKKAPAIAAAQATADAKYTKPGSGIPETDLAAAVQTKLNSGSATIPDGSITNAKISSTAAIDQSKINGLTTALSGKAATSHTHTIANVSGLQDALDSKVDQGGAAGTLNSLTDVDTTDAVDGNALVYSGGTWSPANVGNGNNGSIPDDGSVTAVKIASSAVTTVKISDLNVTGAKLANGAVTNVKIADATIAEAKLDSSVQTKLNATTVIADGSVTEAKLATAVQTKLNAVGTVADGSITNAKLTDATITNAKISTTAAIDQSKINGLTTSLSGKANTSHTHAASDITSGTVATARLGSGTASSTTFLRGDNTWATPAGGGTVTSDSITDATTTGKAVLTASSAATARTAIGAGTSSLALGTSAGTALAGNTAIPTATSDLTNDGNGTTNSKFVRSTTYVQITQMTQSAYNSASSGGTLPASTLIVIVG